MLWMELALLGAILEVQELLPNARLSNVQKGDIASMSRVRIGTIVRLESCEFRKWLFSLIAMELPVWTCLGDGKQPSPNYEWAGWHCQTISAEL